MSVADESGVRVSYTRVDHVRGDETPSVGLALEEDADNDGSANLEQYAVRGFAVPIRRGRHPPSTLERMRPVMARSKVDGDTRSTDHP